MAVSWWGLRSEAGSAVQSGTKSAVVWEGSSAAEWAAVWAAVLAAVLAEAEESAAGSQEVVLAVGLLAGW